MSLVRSYLVCATPRSGSTLLCEGLTATGRAGRPEEFFEALRDTGRPRQPRQYFAGLPDPSLGGVLPETRAGRGDAADGPELIARARRAGTTPNGVFGAKMMWGYLDEFLRRFGALPRPAGAGGRAARLEGLLPGLAYVRVVREDKVRQAISLWKAIQTAAWREGTDAEVAAHPPRYHRVAIDHLAAQLRAQEDGWAAYFGRAGAQPLTVVYEAFVDDYAGTLARVLDFLGIDPPPDGFGAPPLSRQADERSEEWHRRHVAGR